MSSRGPNRPLDARDLEGLAAGVARERGVTKRRVQQWISYMVLCSKLETITGGAQGPRFTIKGGVALELRLRGRARATRDIDLIVDADDDEDLLPMLRKALDGPHQDFTFRVKGGAHRLPNETVRVEVAIRYRGRSWNTVRIDLSLKEKHRLEVELVEALDLSPFHLQPAANLPCLSLRYHLAHKIHGMTRPATDDHPNERVNDFVDVFLLRELLSSSEQTRVREACIDVFQVRDAHEWPPDFTPPLHWRDEFQERAAELNLAVTRFDDAIAEVRGFIQLVARTSPTWTSRQP